MRANFLSSIYILSSNDYIYYCVVTLKRHRVILRKTTSNMMANK